MANIRKSILLSSVSGYGVNVLSLFLIICIARLLKPSEIGVFAIASSFILFANEFKSLGTATYLIRIKKIAAVNIRKSIGLMMLLSWGMGSAIFFASEEIGNYYQLEDLSSLIRLLTFSFLVAPFISVVKSVFTRNFEFGILLAINLITQVAIVASTLVFLFLDYSYFALAYGAIVSNIVELGLVLAFKPRHIPLLPTFSGLSDIAKFGVLITLANVFKRMSFSSLDLIIGKLGTTTEVAVLSRGVGFLDFLGKTIQQSINPVVFPYLSKEIRENRNVQEAYIRATALLGAMVWPALLVAGIASYPIIILLFGDQWVDSAPLAKILCIWAFFRSIHALSDQLLIATHHEKHLLIREIVLFGLNVIAIGTSYRFGLASVALSLSLVSILNFIYTSILLNYLVGIGYLAFAKKLLPIMILVGVLLIEIIALDYALVFSKQEPYISISIVTPVAVISWLVGIRALNLDIYHEISRTAKVIFGSR